MKHDVYLSTLNKRVNDVLLDVLLIRLPIYESTQFHQHKI